MSINPDTWISRCEALGGDRDLIAGISGSFSTPIIGLTFTMANCPESVPGLSECRLEEREPSLYIQSFCMFDKQLCDQVDDRLSLGKRYSMGCVCRGGLYGSVGIRLKRGEHLANVPTIEAFIRQAGVALQRRHLRIKLHQAEEWIQELEALSPETRPA
jgi:hypothetical protein